MRTFKIGVLNVQRCKNITEPNQIKNLNLTKIIKNDLVNIITRLMNGSAPKCEIEATPPREEKFFNKYNCQLFGLSKKFFNTKKTNNTEDDENNKEISVKLFLGTINTIINNYGLEMKVIRNNYYNKNNKKDEQVSYYYITINNDFYYLL